MRIYPINNYNNKTSFKSGDLLSSIENNTPNKNIQNLSPIEKLNSIMSPQELNKAYEQICKSLKLDVIPELKLVNTYKDGWGGGYNFKRHEINLCIEDLTCSDYKIVGVKNNKKIVLESKSNFCPLFASEDLAKEFIKNAKSNNNFGFDSIEMVPTTKEDKKRLILQKISHELIHSQQHQIMRQTEGIGEKEILKAWTHIKPNDTKLYPNIEQITQEEFKKSYWADKQPTPKLIGKNTPIGQLAYLWLESIRNYPPVDSPQYCYNPIEMDAYKRSAQYVYSIFGPLR